MAARVSGAGAAPEAAAAAVDVVEFFGPLSQEINGN